VSAFPKEITDKKFLEELRDQILNVSDFSAEIYCFCSGTDMPSPHDYVGLTHNNCQVDNCIYHRTDANELDVGMLDWGVLACGPFASAIQGGCISGAQVHIYCEYRDKFIEAFMDSYQEHGGPALDLERMKLAVSLQAAQGVTGLHGNTSAILKDCKQAEWATITDIFKDDRVQKKWNAKAWASQFHNSLLIWQKMDLYPIFQKWQKDQGLPAKK